MDRMDRLIRQAMAARPPADPYDFDRLTKEELKEIIYGEPSEKRLETLVEKARR